MGMQCCSAQLTAISHAKKGVKDHGGKEQDDIMDASQGDTLDDTVVDDGTGRIRDSDGESSDSTEVRLCHHSPWASPLRQKSCDLIAAVQVIKHTSTEWTEHVSDSVLLDTSAEGRESPRPPVVPTDPLTESSTDPYWKDGDTEEFTARRIHGLGRRHAERNEDRSNIPLHEREGNREIKEEFTEFLKRTSSTTAATGSVTSTVSKYVGHIFSYPDSWLEFETVQKNELFKAKIHFAFGEPHFQLMSSPMGWVDHTGTVKDEAGRRMERLKAHAAFRRYLLDCIKRDKNKFGTDYAGLVTRGAIQNDIMDIGKTIDESGIWDSLHKMTEQQRQTKKAAVKEVNPEEESKLSGAIAKWNSSSVRQEKTDFCAQLWEKCLETYIKPTKNQFNAFSSFVKLELHNLNRDRAGAYGFSNNAYRGKSPKYLQATEDAAEGEMFSRIFRPIPDGANTDAPPTSNPDQLPSTWVLEVMGDTGGMKKLEATTVVFTPKMKELCDKYRDVKEVFFKVSFKHKTRIV